MVERGDLNDSYLGRDIPDPGILDAVGIDLHNGQLLLIHVIQPGVSVPATAGEVRISDTQQRPAGRRVDDLRLCHLSSKDDGRGAVAHERVADLRAGIVVG